MGIAMPETRYSLSPTEVSDLHIMLSMLPFPPMPMRMDLDASSLEGVDASVHDAFVVATATLVRDSACGEGIVNSHSIIAALSLFHKWSARCADSTIDMRAKTAKEGATLDLVGAVLSFTSPSTPKSATAAGVVGCIQDGSFACTEEKASLVFFETSRAWIQSYLPTGVTMTVRAADMSAIPHEHDLHISMSHYCYAQGVMYSSKDSKLACEMHINMLATLRERVKQASEDPDDAAANNKLDRDECRHMGMELAEMYSKYPYGKLMILCAKRLYNDALYGYKNVDPANVHNNAKALLEGARKYYNATLAGTLTGAVTPNGCKTLSPVDEASDETELSPTTASELELSPITPNTVEPEPVTIHTHIHESPYVARPAGIEPAICDTLAHPFDFFPVASIAILPHVDETVHSNESTEMPIQSVVVSESETFGKTQIASYRSALGILVSELYAVSAEPIVPQQDFITLWRSVCLSLEVCVVCVVLYCLVLFDIKPICNDAYTHTHTAFSRARGKGAGQSNNAACHACHQLGTHEGARTGTDAAHSERVCRL